MEQRLNKPRVFLSHSKNDEKFINEILTSFQKCQIEPWLDSIEIRHGKPWLDSIFEDGIPTCDAVIVYFTESSIKSQMVKKEIDAGILQQLKDNSIAFLPYVSDQDLRRKLRSDIQTLQVPVWNEENFLMLLPIVVAEIWRSYLERSIPIALQKEEVKRLKAELELEKIKKQNTGVVFNNSEVIEFEYLKNTLDTMVPIKAVEYEIVQAQDDVKKHTLEKTYNLQVNLGSIIALLLDYGVVEYNWRLVRYFVQKDTLKKIGINTLDDSVEKAYIKEFPDFSSQLLMFGFIENVVSPSNKSPTDRLNFDWILTEKYYRYRYWLTYNNNLPTEICIEIIK